MLGLRYTRRAFVAGAAKLFGLGTLGAAGLSGCDEGGSRRPAGDVPEAYRYDVSKLAEDDGGLPRWQAVERVPTPCAGARAITRKGWPAVGHRSRIVLVDGQGKQRFDWPTPEAVTAVAFSDDAGYLVAGGNRVHHYSGDGGLIESWTVGDARSHVTSIASVGDDLFVADAGRRAVSRYRAGDRVWTIEDFHVPSPYFDLAIEGQTLWVAHTGRHRLEAYNFTGELQRHWGKAGMAIDGFCGCCNPCHFVVRSDGRFITSEKGLHRVKLCSAGGEVEQVIATAADLDMDVNAPMPRPGEAAVPAGPLVADLGVEGVAVFVPATGVLHRFVPPAGQGAGHG